MKYLLLAAVLPFALTTTAGASTCPAPADNLPELVRAPLLESCDTAAAYHAARISLARGEEAAARLWLEHLAAIGWQLGMESDHALAADLNKTPAPEGASRVLHMLGARDFFAEGIAADEARGRLFIGSLTQNAVMVVGDNVEQTLWKLPEAGPLRAIYGMKYDGQTNELWLLHNRGDLTGEVKLPPQAELVVLDGLTGTVKRTASPQGDLPAELNDLCLTPDAAYVTDSRNHMLYRVRRETLEFGTIALPDVRYPNGIACEGSTVYVADWRGVTRLDAASGTAERLATPAGETLGGIDGLVLHDGALMGVQNGFKFPRIIRASLDGKQIKTQDISHPAYDIPTTGTVMGDSFVYIANSQMDRVGTNTPARLKPLTLLTLPLE